MNKNLSLALLGLLAIPALADEVPGMTITQTDGSTIAVSIAQIRSIKYQDGVMMINQTDGKQQTLAVDVIEQIHFADMESAITAVIGDQDTEMTITDLNGRILYRGQRNGYSDTPTPAGTYIITVDGKSHRVNIR